MNIIRRLLRALKGDVVHPYDLTGYVLDHVPVDSDDDWRKGRLAAAARKHGKPFKCAVEGLPHEVLLIGRKSAAADETEAAARRDNVARFTNRRA